MHYIAFLLLWMEVEAGQPPVAAFIQHFSTYAECEAYRSRVKDPEIMRRTACMLTVVEPKKGIKE
ncbi:MAG TPA: hypothetical protein VGE56_00775 [Rhodocyclaceae bacterium]